jgi:undecaprenyl-diphosphatase
VWVLVTVLALASYAVLAAAVVRGGPLVDVDGEVATWVAREMPTWAEWLARPFTWAGGMVGIAVTAALLVAWSFRHALVAQAVLALVVAIGVEVLVAVTKTGYERERPDVGSAIALPSSYSFPSGHAAGGIAVFGLAGLALAATRADPRARRRLVAAGLALGVLAGASRVVLNVHYVADVLAGFCFGLAWLAACILGERGLRSRPWRR